MQPQLTAGSRVLVTGAAGFIGAALCRQLSGLGCEVVGIDNERSGDWSRVDVEIERHERGIETLTTGDWSRLLNGVDVVFHLAAEKYNSSQSTPERVLETNVLAMQRLIAGAATAQVGRIVFTSSLYAYGSLGPASMSEGDVLAPTTTYGASKAMGEYLLATAHRDGGPSFNIARLFFIYGPGQYAEGGYKSVIVSNFERLMRKEEPTIYGDGSQTLDYVYLDDCIDALTRMAMAEEDSLVANVASGRGVTINDLTMKMQSIAQSELSPIRMAADWTAGSRRVGESGLIARKLGWSASVDLDDGLQRVWDWSLGRENQ